jgi:hypothetical protein
VRCPRASTSSWRCATPLATTRRGEVAGGACRHAHSSTCTAHCRPRHLPARPPCPPSRPSPARLSCLLLPSCRPSSTPAAPSLSALLHSCCSLFVGPPPLLLLPLCRPSSTPAAPSLSALLHFECPRAHLRGCLCQRVVLQRLAVRRLHLRQRRLHPAQQRLLRRRRRLPKHNSMGIFNGVLDNPFGISTGSLKPTAAAASRSPS